MARFREFLDWMKKNHNIHLCKFDKGTYTVIGDLALCELYNEFLKCSSPNQTDSQSPFEQNRK